MSGGANVHSHAGVFFYKPCAAHSGAMRHARRNRFQTTITAGSEVVLLAAVARMRRSHKGHRL
jgi:hypothetical protein